MKTTFASLFLAIFLVICLAGVISTPALANTPDLTVSANPDFGTWSFSGMATPPVPITITSDDPAGIAFSWLADASSYGATIAGYRMGWDISDPDDSLDPGWIHGEFGPWLDTEPRIFNNGIHFFLLEALDSAGGVTQATFLIDVQQEVAVESKEWNEIKTLFR